MKTRADLIASTLKLLNAIAAGQTPEPEDVAEIDAILDGKLDELNDREVVYFSDYEEFEDRYIDPLAIILANTAAPGFGQPRNPDSVANAERTLQAFKASSYVGQALQVDYF